ncbi:MAG: cytochrome c4 [Hahellaceae bacterium]|nr:cytochrome c4 [Hahellaceae bacterium]MCP5170481.1 cytochrome c4 [Hahellaceae bacterium]
MKKIVAGLVVAMGLTGMAHAAGDAAAGQQNAMVCGGCHGTDGNSMVPNFPKLAGQGEKYLLKQMKDIKGGARAVPEMTGILTAFSDQDLENIAAYFSSQKVAVGQAAADMVAKGQSLYRAGNKATGVAACTACHGPSGKGVELAAFPSLSGQHPQYVENQLKKFRSGERTNDGDSQIMRSIAGRLTDAEISAVASYVSGLH